MPLEYTRDDARRWIRLVATAPLSVDDVQAVLQRQLAEGTWTYGTLVDLRRAALSTAEAGSVFRQFSELVARHGPNGPVAIVAHDEGLGSAQVFSFRSAELKLRIEVFWDLVEAEEWLARQT